MEISELRMLFSQIKAKISLNFWILVQHAKLMKIYKKIIYNNLGLVEKLYFFFFFKKKI